jgi:hypothetical protein
MTQIEIAGDRLKIEVLGWDKLWSFKSRLNFALKNVLAARVAENLPKFGYRGLRALRVPGTHLSGVITAGSYYYYQQGKWAFWDVHDMKKAIEIDLQNEAYAHLVIEVKNPQEVVRLIESQIRRS